MIKNKIKCIYFHNLDLKIQLEKRRKHTKLTHFFNSKYRMFQYINTNKGGRWHSAKLSSCEFDCLVYRVDDMLPSYIQWLNL